MRLCNADLATPIQLYAGNVTELSKSSPTIDPPAVISGTNASASTFSEYVEMCRATATSSHVAPMKLSPSSDCGANPMACSTPSTRSQWAATASPYGVGVTGVGDVELEHRDVVAAGQLAGRPFRQTEPATGSGQHQVGAFLAGEPGDRIRQRRVGQHPGDHDVLTVEDDPSEVDRSLYVCVCKARRHAHRHPRRHRSCW